MLFFTASFLQCFNANFSICLFIIQQIQLVAALAALSTQCILVNPLFCFRLFIFFTSMLAKY